MAQPVYNWNRWFAKRSFRIKRGRHFRVTPYIMAQQIRNRASRLGLLVTIKVKDDTIQVSNIRKAA